MSILAIRGATTVECNTKEEILKEIVLDSFAYLIPDTELNIPEALDAPNINKYQYVCKRDYQIQQ